MDGEDFPEVPGGSNNLPLSASLKRTFDRLSSSGDHNEATDSNPRTSVGSSIDRNGNKRLRSGSPARAPEHAETSVRSAPWQSVYY